MGVGDEVEGAPAPLGAGTGAHAERARTSTSGAIRRRVTSGSLGLRRVSDSIFAARVRRATTTTTDAAAAANANPTIQNAWVIASRSAA